MAEVTERDREAANRLFFLCGSLGDFDAACAFLAEWREARLAESEAARALLKSERDACREDRNQLEAERGDWTNIKCDTCKGYGENDNAMPCSQCAGEGRLWLTWKQQFDLSEAARVKAEQERDTFKHLGHQLEADLDAAEARLRDLVEAADRVMEAACAGKTLQDLIAAYRRVRDAQPAIHDT